MVKEYMETEDIVIEIEVPETEEDRLIMDAVMKPTTNHMCCSKMFTANVHVQGELVVLEQKCTREHGHDGRHASPYLVEGETVLQTEELLKRRKMCLQKLIESGKPAFVEYAIKAMFVEGGL